jgi:aspartate kinase
VSYKREITTLGRGGSDTTAVALAAALGAERCEIYSDVDGVYSADPRVVDDPEHLPEIDLATLQEMAEAGAKVVNAQAVEWARRAGIAIHARRTSDRPEAARETIAREAAAATSGRASRVRAVVGLDRVAVLRAPEGVARLAELAGDRHLPLLDIAWSGGAASAVMPLLNVPDWEARLDGAGLEVATGASLVSVVGSELDLCAFSSVLDDVGAIPQTVAAGPLRIAATIPAEKLAAAERALHARFVRA